MAESRWQPKTFLRYEETVLGSSTQPARIVTDAGKAFIKAMDNPLGPHVLVREWVGTSLARWFGLPTFESAIMALDDKDVIPLPDGGFAGPGPAFVTRAETGHKWGGDAEELELLDNPETLTRLVVFDTWTLNPDRYPPPTVQRGPHPDNVFLSEEHASAGKFRLIAMDFTECFEGSSRELSGKLARIDRIRNDEIWGLFPEFHSFIRREELEKAAARLRELDEKTVTSFLDDIPREWQFSVSAKMALKDLIRQRAGFLADIIVDKIRKQAWV